MFTQQDGTKEMYTEERLQKIVFQVFKGWRELGSLEPSVYCQGEYCKTLSTRFSGPGCELGHSSCSGWSQAGPGLLCGVSARQLYLLVLTTVTPVLAPAPEPASTCVFPPTPGQSWSVSSFKTKPVVLAQEKDWWHETVTGPLADLAQSRGWLLLPLALCWGMDVSVSVRLPAQSWPWVCVLAAV